MSSVELHCSTNSLARTALPSPPARQATQQIADISDKSVSVRWLSTGSMVNLPSGFLLFRQQLERQGSWRQRLVRLERPQLGQRQPWRRRREQQRRLAHPFGRQR
uniref:Uncharacterized protein n=1 Tax=Bactrocera dorsalis TaxID=27457 RepID=A0A034W8F4_BACDO